VLLLRQALSPKSSCAGGSQFEADFPVSGGYSIHLFLENMCASALAAALLRNQHEIKRAMGRKTPLSVLYAYGQTECTSLPVVTEDNEN
jgi:hypothetical protein